MSTEQTVLTTDLARAPGATAPSGTATATPGRARRWLVGATLVTVGLVAGSGATYAVTAPGHTDLPSPVTRYGVPAGGAAGGDPLGTAPQTGDGTTGGEST